MNQDQWIILLFRIFLISGFVSLVAWVVVYTRLTGWANWKNPIGQTLVIKTSLVALLLVPSILALFFHFSRATSITAAWVDVALIGLITPVMLWRTAVWVRIYRKPVTETIPEAAAARIAQLEAENARLRGQLERPHP